ncbi:MAG TPA: Hsp20/alpha crystallin family protein [Anaerolineae bacterium]|nr:Hsp20/alpha crystallin family protein [Anaerolineae bacterium]
MYRDPFFNTRAQAPEMERLRQEMNRLFTNFPSYVRPAPAYPALNAWTSEEGVIITAELPGCNPDAIELAVVGDTLTITGAREPEEVAENATYHRRERGCGKFQRSLQLPFEVEAGKVEATFDKGVLHISLPRAEASKPKKIAIKIG